MNKDRDPSLRGSESYSFTGNPVSVSLSEPPTPPTVTDTNRDITVVSDSLLISANATLPSEPLSTPSQIPTPSRFKRALRPVALSAAAALTFAGMVFSAGEKLSDAQAHQEALKPPTDGNTLLLPHAPLIDRTPVAGNKETVVSPETTTNYTVNKFAWKGNRIVFTGNVDGSSDEKMFVMDIDFILRKGLGKIVDKPPITIRTLSVNGDNIVAAGTELSDPKKGALWYSQHGGATAKIASSETNQVQLGPVQRTFIPDGYDPVNGYDPTQRNKVVFQESDPNDPNNLPKIARVLDMNTGVIDTLSGKVEPDSEGQLLPVAPNLLKSPATNENYIGYFLKTYDLETRTITSTWKYDGTNYGLLDNPTQYFRESDRKRITLTFNPYTEDSHSNPVHTGTMNYNIEDASAYSIEVNRDDPAYFEYTYPTPHLGAEGKSLYMVVTQQVDDPVTFKSRFQAAVVEIDPPNYADITKQKVIGTTRNGLPSGDIFNGIPLAFFIVKDGEGGDIPVLIYKKGLWMQKEDGTWGQIPVEKVVPPTATATNTATSTATATRTPTPTAQDKFPYKVRMPVIRDAAQGTPASGGW